MARFFIDRPVFAIVIAIVIVILGLVAIPNLPIAAFPEVVPPVVQVTAILSKRRSSAAIYQSKLPLHSYITSCHFYTNHSESQLWRKRQRNQRLL